VPEVLEDVAVRSAKTAKGRQLKPPNVVINRLFVGRKQQSVDGSVRFEVIPTITDVYADDPTVKIVTEQTYRVFVNNRLFATIRTGPKKRSLHSPIRLYKDLRSGKVTLRLLKKYTELADG
jgi:hypothetical protein